jgi:hypothetical protein
VQTIGLDLKQPIPRDLHLTTRNLPGIPNEPNSRWPESGVARYVAVSCPHPASIGSHTQPPNHHPKASDSRLSIASLPAQGVCAFLSITLPAVDTCSSQSVTGFTSPSSLLSSCHPSGAGAFLHTPAVIRAPPPTFPPNFPDWQRHLQKKTSIALHLPTGLGLDTHRLIILALPILPSQPRRQPRSLGHPLTILQTGIPTTPHYRAYTPTPYSSTFT